MRQHFLGEGSKIEEEVMMDRYKKSADMGEGGIKNSKKSADILYGRPLLIRLQHESSIQLVFYKKNNLRNTFLNEPNSIL